MTLARTSSPPCCSLPTTTLLRDAFTSTASCCAGTAPPRCRIRGFDAFESPNEAPLGTVGIDIALRRERFPTHPLREYAGVMNTIDLSRIRAFDDTKMQKVPVFTSPYMIYDLYCLRPGQEQRVHTHADSDKAYLVLEGEAVFDVGGEQELVAQGTSVLAQAGQPHGVRNDSDSVLVLLVTMAPRPA